MAERERENARTLAVGALGGGAAFGAAKLIESLAKRAEAAPGEAVPVTLDPETLQLLIAMAQGINEISKGVAANTAGINTLLTAAGEPTPVRKIEQIPYRATLTEAGLAGSGVKMVEYAPKTGYIKWIMVHYPPGTNALVDVAVGHGLEQLCPREGYLALDNTTQIFYFNEYVEDHEEIWVEMLNGDGTNPHTITVTIGFEREI